MASEAERGLYREILSETTKRRRMLGLLAGLRQGVAFAGLGIALDAIAHRARHRRARLRRRDSRQGADGDGRLPPRHHESSRSSTTATTTPRSGLEQFDKGTRVTFTNLSKSLKDASEHRAKLADLIEKLSEEVRSKTERLDQAVQAPRREALDAAVKSTESQSAKLTDETTRLSAEIDRVAKEQEKLVEASTASSNSVSKKLDESEAQSKELVRLVEQLQEADDRLEAAISAAEESFNAKLEEQDRLRACEEDEGIARFGSSGDRQVDRPHRDDRQELRARLVAHGAPPRRGRAIRKTDRGRLHQGDPGDLGRSSASISPSAKCGISSAGAAPGGDVRGSHGDDRRGRCGPRAGGPPQRGDEIKVLEIGVLFGVSGDHAHALTPFYKKVRLVLLDPSTVLRL